MLGHFDGKVIGIGPCMQERMMEELGLGARANALNGLQAAAMAVLTRGGGA